MQPIHTPRLLAHGPIVATTGLIHRVWEPAQPGPHPTVVLLHGRSGNEDVMWIFAATIPSDWLILAPRAPHPDPAGGYAWHPPTPDEWPCLNEFGSAVTAVTRFIHTLPHLYHADPTRIYLMGFSQGAAAAYAIVLTYPRLIQGIAALVGFVPTACDAATPPPALPGLPIFMAVGRADPLIPFTRAQADAQTLRTAGANLTYHEYPTAHKLPPSGAADLQTWWQTLKFNFFLRS